MISPELCCCCTLGQEPHISDTFVPFCQRRMRFAGHCARATNQPAEKLVFWTPSEGKTRIGRRLKTYSTMLQEDTGLRSEKEILSLMEDRVF